MEVTTKIRRPLADEHVIGTDPPLRPELADVWRRRINPFAGRAISDKALTAEQDVRSGMQRVVGLALAPGSVEGMEVLLDAGAIGSEPEAALFQVAPGLGITRSGEDVGVGALRQLSFGMLPVILRTDHADKLEGEGAPDEIPVPAAARPSDEPEGEMGSMAARLRPVRPRRLGQTLAEIAANPESGGVPHVGVLVAQPVTATILGRPVDDCPPDPRDDAYADLQRIDGCRLVFYLWPEEVTAIDGGPDYALPATKTALRNRLAYAVFDTEKLLEADEMHPWEEWGVPLALAAFDERWQLSFIDRFAVARIGGTPKARTAMVPMSGEARLWQARIDQFVHHLADLPDLREERLREEFVRVPPVGLLPPEMFDPVLRRQHFFPGNYGVSAVPVPRSNLELAVGEVASLASFNRGTPDRVEMLVPVPDHVYEPGLLEVAVEDPRFTEAITAFREDRATWLSRREGARRRYDRLMESVSGLVTGWALAELPMEENSPAPRTQVPVEISRTRRFNEQSAARTHVMVGAHATLPVAKSDTIWMWLRIHSDTQMTGLSLRLGTGTGTDPAGPFAAGVYWGDPAAMPIASEPDLEVRRQGDLPDVGVWHRLEVPASAIWMIDGGNLDGFSVNGVEFTQRGGEVEWGSFGKTDVNGLNYTYIGDDAPAGATLVTSGQGENGWPWQDVEGRAGLDVPDFGTVRTGDVRRVGAIDGFRVTWTQDFLATDMAKLDENGLSEFLAEVEGRLKATNDAVDLGFVRARSDIYRVRQIMLGADSASRLVTSPSLADLAARDEGARATSRGIADFLANVGLTRVPGAQQPPPITAAQAQVSTQAQQPLMLMSAAFSPRIMTLNTATTLEARRSTSLSTSSFATLAAVSSPAVASVSAPAVAAPSVTAAASTPLFAGPSTFAATGFAATFQPAMSLTAARFAMDETRYRPRDIQLQLPVAGLVERTASVAERLTVPPAVQALNYAIATKAALIETLSSLRSSNNSRPNGIYLEDIPMPGFAKREIQPNDAIVLNEAVVPTLAEVLTDRLSQHRQFEDTDKLPQGDKHESDYFTAAVKAIDNSIAIMRLVEGRIALFEQLAQHIRDLRQEILDLANQAAAYLRSIDVEVEEARHDLTMAQQLRAEEQARVDATNARRSNVLATHVQAVAWRRVRECDHRTLAPALEIGSALAEDPVVACRREHEDVADEIEDYVELLRDAPVRWFPRIAREVDRIQRLEAARAAIEAMRYRAMIPLRFFAPPPPTAPKFLRGVHNALLTQRRLVEERRVTIQQMNLSLLHTLSLAQSQVQIRQMATIGDLLDNRHRQPALTRMASEEIDGIETVAGCLHESFGEVAPIIRLRWAEDLSEFDRPAPLHSLAGLPGWPEVPLDQRRTLQSFVDWLFRRIDRNDQEATDAINELIRICLLMASHAPVDRLIPAQLVEPAPARVGGRIQLALDISRVRRGMIALIRDRDDQIVSRAVIEDLIDGHASAVITQNLQAVTTISTDMRFQLMSGKA